MEIIEVEPAKAAAEDTTEAKPQKRKRQARAAAPYIAKTLIFWVLFIVLHFAHDWAPSSAFIAVFSGINESFIQHGKIGFWSYFFVAAGEALLHAEPLRRRFPKLEKITHKIDCWRSFAASRLMTLLLQPWVMFVVWFIPAMFFGPWPNDVGEAVWANIALLIMFGFLLVFERDAERETFSTASVVIVTILVLLEAVHLTVLTFRLPWARFFWDVTSPSSEQVF